LRGQRSSIYLLNREASAPIVVFSVADLYEVADRVRRETGGAALVFGGRFAFDNPAVTVAGSVLLVAAALTNATRCRRST